jgi:hypothetical protein
MEKCKIIDTSGTIAAGIGLLLCSAAGFARLFGAYYLAGFQGITLFTAGTAFLILAVLFKIQVLIEMRP